MASLPQPADETRATDFGAILRHWRRARGISQLELASRAGMSARIEPIDFSSAWMAWYEAPYREVVEKLVRDHDGRVHLGKNKKWLFQLERTEGTYGSNVTRFNEALVSLGAGNRFQNDFAADLGIVFP
jgi:transcriptional regulator with XRE-family HTH domain